MKSGDLNKYDLVKNTLVLVLAGGRGSRLHELTDKRAKPALYFGGNRRIIDFALSTTPIRFKPELLLNMRHTPCFVICKQAGLSYRKSVANLLICCQLVSKLTILLGIVARRMRYIKIWLLLKITIARNIF